MAQLITRVDSEEESVHVYRFDAKTWVFKAHLDPGLDFVILPDGVVAEAYVHNGECPEHIPQQLWDRWFQDSSDGAWGEEDHRGE